MLQKVKLETQKTNTKYKQIFVKLSVNDGVIKAHIVSL